MTQEGPGQKDVPRGDGPAPPVLSQQAINDILDYATVFQRNLDGTIMFWNQGSFDMYGWSPEEALGKVSHELLKTVFPQPLSEIQKSLMRRRMWQGELRHCHKDGREIVVVSKWILREVSAGIEHVVEINSDVTGLARAEADQARLAAIVASSDAAIVSKDLDGIVTSWNEGAEAMFGWRAEEIVGRSIAVIASRDKPDEMREILTRIKAGGRIAHFETERSRKDGSRIAVSLSVSPIYDKSGRIVGASKIANDITERKALDDSIRAALAEKEALLGNLAAEVTARERVTEALRRSEEDLRSFFDLSPQWPWACGPDGIVWDLPERFSSFLGLSVKAAVTGGWRALNHPDDQARIDQAWAAALKTGEPYDQEVRTKLPDGEYRWLRIRAFARKDATGRVVRWYGVTEDIHAQKVAELALKASEENLRAFFELSPQAPWIGDANGRPVEVSPQMKRMARFLTGSKGRDGWPELVHPDDLELVERTWTHSLSTGAQLDQEYRVKTPDGDFHWFRTRAFSQNDAEGKIQRWFGVMEDIHDHKLAQMALSDSEERFRRIYEESPLGIVLMRADDASIVEINPSAARAIEMEPHEAVGRKFLDILQPGDDSTAALEAVPIGRRWSMTERNFVTRSGKAVSFRIRVSLLPPVNGQADMILGVSEDITGQRRAEAALAQAQKMEAVGQLTGGIAHDFNNLLSVVIGNLDMLRSMKRGDDDVQDLGGEAMSAALRGADLVRRLLAFARKQPLQPTKFDVNEAVSSIVKLLGRILGENIEISMKLGQDIWSALADQAQLEAALTNLATNARDAMPGGGALTIATANRHLDADYATQHPDLSPGDYVMIEVTDSGVGMPPEILAQIFEPFFTTKERGKGSGLGLSMVFGYVKQSGGHVNVYSEPGAGTTFRLYLPRATHDAGIAPSAGPASDLAYGRGETILVVEDSAALRRIVVRQLKDLGYRVVEASDGAEALDMLKRETVDLLFTDIVMPGKMDGFALAQAAKERWPSVKVLLTSGFPETKLSDQYELAGYRLLSKPYLKEELARLLRAALD
jgi:PAS domain S-box-containing protein